MLYRQGGLTPTVRAIAWKVQRPLTGRFRRLMARGKTKPNVATTIARELTGFTWAIAREVPAPPASATSSGPSGRRHRGQVENPRSRDGHPHDGDVRARVRQLRDEPQSGRYQPADLSSVNRR
jgi:hypothetical protein